MTFYRDLYVGDSIHAKADKIIQKIKLNKATPDIFVLSLSQRPGDILELIPAWEIQQKSYPRESLQIIGLAKGKKEALALVQSIVEQIYTLTGGCDISKFFSERQEESLWR